MAKEHLVSENRYLAKGKKDFNGKGVTRHLPEVRVSFHTEKECYTAKGKVIPWNQTELDPSYQVLSVNTQKTLHNPAGGFTVSLAGSQWVNRLKSNDLVVIKMGYKGQKLDTVMVGLIDTVTRRRSMAGEQPQVTTTVIGRDFGKLFLKSVLRFYPEIGAQKSDSASKFFLTDVGWINMLKIFSEENITKGSPAVILDRIMRFIMTKLNETEWHVYDERGSTPKKKKVSFGSIVRYAFQQVDFFLPFMLTADQFEGSVWNLMERATQKPFTELFIDTRDASETNMPGTRKLIPTGSIETTSNKSSQARLPKDKGYYPYPAVHFGEVDSLVYLTYRTAPFDTTSWKKLRKHVLDTNDVISDEISRTDNEHYNLFWAGTTINPLGIDLKRAMPPLINETDVKRYGISPLEVQIEGLEVLREKSTDHGRKLEGLSGKYSGILKAWFQDNHEYWSGNFEVRGKSSYRVGQVLAYESQDLEFYIEGVTQNFNVFTSWTTALTVTRGKKSNVVIDSNRYIRKPSDPPAPPKPSTPKPKPKPTDTYYTVKRGDTLWAIAKRFYGKGSLWRKIWEANKDMLIKRDRRNIKDNGRWIYPNQKLRIPPK